MKYDQFQVDAIAALDAGKHVIVSAPTSSGKTCIAEYLLVQRRFSVIYTAPTKALCNQKFADFSVKGYSIGLLTGDREVNEEKAVHLVMTTEILLKMLVQNDIRIGTSRYYVFDEFHFIGDKSRGHVWEECILKSPEGVQMLFLSATIPNYLELGEWISRCTGHDLVSILETKRPVPLEFRIYQKNGTSADISKRTYVEKPRGGRRSDWIQLAQWLKKENITPAICFVFNRWECHEHAKYIQSVDFLTEGERSHVLRTIKDVEMDNSLKYSLLRGVGVHHSGLVTKVREIVEFLTAQGILQVVFATETLAIGLNMPTRTVVFESLNKHDEEQRLLNPAEFKQLIGRAGRRGHDIKGTVLFPWWINSVDIDRLIDQQLPRIQSQLEITIPLVLRHEREILHSSFLLYTEVIQRDLSDEKQWVDLEDQVELFELAQNLPFYKLKKKFLLRYASYGLSSTLGYVSLDRHEQIRMDDFLGFADKNHKVVPFKGHLLYDKTLWFIENQTRIYALMAKQPGPIALNIEEVVQNKNRWDNFMVQELCYWDQIEEYLNANGYVLGSLQLAAAKCFYSVDPIKAVEFLIDGGLKKSTHTELLCFFASLLKTKITEEHLQRALAIGTKNTAAEFQIFEGDIDSSLMRIHNVIKEFRSAAEILFGGEMKILEIADKMIIFPIKC